MSTFGRRPGLRRLDVALGAPGRRGVAVSAAGRGRPSSKKTANADAAVEGSDRPPLPRRLSRILQAYENPEDEELEALAHAEQRAAAAAAAPKTRDGRPPRRAARAAKFAAGGEELAAKRAAMFTINPATGEPSPIVGYYGGGRPQWWALRVNPGREKQVADAIERLLPQLPPLEGSDEPRTAECWAPAKKIRAWSPKTGRMGAKALKYDDGGWLIVKTVLDTAFSQMLAGNINVQGFRDREVFDGAEFPRPASPELMKTLKAWEEDLSDLGEAEVKSMVGLAGERLPAVSSATEEFFFDEDAEELERRMEERAERGGRGGRGRRGGRDAGRGRGGRGRGFYGSEEDDRPRARREDRGRDRDSAGSGWYAGGGADAADGWYTGGAAAAGSTSGSADSFDFGEEGDFSGAGWFAGRTSDADDLPTNPGGGLLTDDDLEFWGGGSGAGAAAAGVSGDDLDAVWGADADGGAFGGWMPLDEPGFEAEERARGGRGRGSREWEDRGGRGRGREDRERGRGRGRDEWAPRGAREERAPRSSRRDDDESGGGGERYSAPAWGTDDLSWWDDPAGGGGDTGTASSAPAADDFSTPKSSGKSSKAKSDAPAPAAADVDDWFGSDAAGAWEDFGGADSGAAEPSLPAGTPIEVVSGRFADFEGVVVEDKGGGRVKAELDVFGTPTVVEVSRGEVESLED